MPIDADKVRELAARGEGTKLDFKREDYNWGGGRAANAELAKDLMAIANILGPTSESAYILVGVDDDGTIVGITAHEDDADLHGRVRPLLNHSPNFLYYAVDVDGRSVGVFEILPGGRPYFAVSATPPLQRQIALYRDGTRTDVASPTQIIAWSREDDAETHELRALELRERLADTRVVGELGDVVRSAGPQDVRINFSVSNLGRRSFSISTCRWRVEWTPAFFEEIRVSLAKGSKSMEAAQWSGGEPPGSYQPPGGEFSIERAGDVPPQLAMKRLVEFRWTRLEALQHFAEQRVPVAGFNGQWCRLHFEVPCVGELGEHATLRITSA